MALKPFVDRPNVDIEKNNQRAAPKQTYTAPDMRFADGTSLKTMGEFSQRMVFTSVQDYTEGPGISHEIKQSTFGQTENGSTGLSPFEDRVGIVNPVDFVNQPEPYTAFISSGEILEGGSIYVDTQLVSNGVDFSARDGVIDAIGTRDSIPYVAIQGEVLDRGIACDSFSMSELGNFVMDQHYSWNNPGSCSTFIDSSDNDIKIGNFSLSRVGISNIEPGKDGAYSDVSPKRSDDFYFLGQVDYGFVSYGMKSAGAGFTYTNNLEGTDSIAFGGFKR